MTKPIDPHFIINLIAEEIDDDESSNMADALAKCVANTKVLSQRAHAFHWNYEGESFAELHEVFGNIYDDLSEKVDELAERIRALDATPPSSLNKFLDLSTIDDKCSDSTESIKMISNMVEGYKQLIECFKDSLKLANDQKDDASIDMLGSHLKDIEKTLWMLKSTK